jgi:hypothetical protein
VRSCLYIFVFAASARGADPAPVQAKWELPASAVKATALAWLPDGTGVVYGDGSATTRIWDISVGREIATLAPPKQGLAWIYGVAASRDGKRIAIANGTIGLRIWDRASNRETTVSPSELFAGVPHDLRRLPGVEGVGFHDVALVAVSSLQSIARVAPDGRLLGKAVAMPIEFGDGEKAYIREEAVVSPRANLGLAYYEGHDIDELRVWDYAKGAVAASATLKELTRPVAQAISSDGRWAIVRDLRRANDQRFFLFDVRSLKQIGSIALGQAVSIDLHRAEFSDDGRLLLVLPSNTPAIIYDVARLSPMAQLDLEHYSCWRFSTDNRRIAMGHAESRITIHDLRAAVDPNPPAAHDPIACWNDLVSANGATAMRAIYRLADRPAETVKFIETRLKPVTKPDAADLTKWLADLNAPAFADRQTAMRKLAAVADAILAELNREVMTNAAPETVEAIRTLLESTDRSRRKLEGDYLRAYRTVQVLEYCGSAADELLKRYAAGAAGAALTTEAAGAIARRK